MTKEGHLKLSTRLYIGISAFVVLTGATVIAGNLLLQLMNEPDSTLVVFGVLGLVTVAFLNFRANYYIARILFNR